MLQVQDDEILHGPSRTLTDAHLLFFSSLTGDLHPIHYDKEYARTTRFGEPVAHGLHLAALTALGASNGRERVGALAFVEQGSKFIAPAKVGDTIQPMLQLERRWEESGRRFCRFKTWLVNQRGEIILTGFQVYQILNTKSKEDN